MTDSTLSPPAGWYTDPEDASRQRYWDGQSWAPPAIVESPEDRLASQKTLTKSYLWWFPLGIFGAHHFYMGRKVWGWVTAVTLNFLLIGWVVDGILLPYWFVRIEKDRQLVQGLRTSGRGVLTSTGQLGRELGKASVESAKILGPAAVEVSVQVGQAVRLGGISMNREKTELNYQRQYVPASVATVSVIAGTATSRMSGSNVVGGAVVGGMVGLAGAGAVVGATARTNTTKIYIVVDFPGGQWTAETSHKNESYARRFAAKVNSI